MPAKATKEINKTDICPKTSPEEEGKTYSLHSKILGKKQEKNMQKNYLKMQPAVPRCDSVLRRLNCSHPNEPNGRGVHS